MHASVLTWLLPHLEAALHKAANETAVDIRCVGFTTVALACRLAVSASQGSFSLRFYPWLIVSVKLEIERSRTMSLLQ